MTFNARDPFRLHLDDDATADIADVILTMPPLTAPVEVSVHSEDPGGGRVVSARVGSHVVLYRVAVTPEQYAQVQAAADRYNTDAAAGWDTLAGCLLAAHLGLADIPHSGSDEVTTLLTYRQGLLNQLAQEQVRDLRRAHAGGASFLLSRG